RIPRLLRRERCHERRERLKILPREVLSETRLRQRRQVALVGHVRSVTELRRVGKREPPFLEIAAWLPRFSRGAPQRDRLALDDRDAHGAEIARADINCLQHRIALQEPLFYSGPRI